MMWRGLWCVGMACLCGCAGSPGRIVNAISPDASFVRVEQEFNTYNEAGELVTMNLKGERGEPVVPRGYALEAASPDGELLVLGNADTDLFIYERAKGKAPHEVVEVRGHASGVAISPDKTRVAVSLHPEYNALQHTGPEGTDDAIYIIDVATKQVDLIPASRKGWVMTLAWTEPERMLMHWRPTNESIDEGVWLDVTTGKRTPAIWPGGQELIAPWRKAPTECEGVQLGEDDLGLYERTGGAPPHYIVPIEGRKRGFHDHFETISSYHFIGDCDHVLFTHDRKLYVYQRSSKRTAYLGQGRETWYFSGK